MSRFLTLDFALLVLLVVILIVVHEAGHYLAYLAFGIPARVRRSFIAPGIDPIATVCVSRGKGLFVALNGFLFAGVLLNLTAYLLGYRYSHVLLLGALVGSAVDFIWAVSMLGRKTVTLHAR